MTWSKLPRPPLVTRKVSWISWGPSIEIPTRNSCSLKNSAHSWSSLVPFVWIVYARALPRAQVPVGKLHRAPEELDTHQRRLAALPGDLHDRDARVRLDQLTDVGLE